MPVVWHTKAIGMRMAQGSAVRISSRGIRFIPNSHTLSIDEKVWKPMKCYTARDALCHLQPRDIIVSSSASSGDDASGRVFRGKVFPNGPYPAFVTQGYGNNKTYTHADGTKTYHRFAYCPETWTGRTVVPARPAISIVAPPSERYDVSLCNLMGVGSEFVYQPKDSTLYECTDPIGSIPLVTASILIIAMMMIVGYNLENILAHSCYERFEAGDHDHDDVADDDDDDDDGKDDGDSDKKQKDTPFSIDLTQDNRKGGAPEAGKKSTSSGSSSSSNSGHKFVVGSMLALLLVSWVPNTASGTLFSTFVTEEDLWAFLVCSIHVGYYIVRIIAELVTIKRSSRVQREDRLPRPINPVLACIFVSLQRMHSSAENPYTGTVAFLMLCWTLHKMSMFDREAEGTVSASNARSSSFEWPSLFISLDIVFDCAVICILVHNGSVIRVRQRTHQ
jgi:hypothetical protein